MNPHLFVRYQLLIGLTVIDSKVNAKYIVYKNSKYGFVDWQGKEIVARYMIMLIISATKVSLKKVKENGRLTCAENLPSNNFC